MASRYSDNTAMRLIARVAAKFSPPADPFKTFEAQRLQTFSLYAGEEEPQDDFFEQRKRRSLHRST
jgi:hypothetical protein